MIARQITPTQISLFSRSHVVGAWWEELRARRFFKEHCPDDTELDMQLFADGLWHEEVLIAKLEKQGYCLIAWDQESSHAWEQVRNIQEGESCLLILLVR